MAAHGLSSQAQETTGSFEERTRLGVTVQDEGRSVLAGRSSRCNQGDNVSGASPRRVREGTENPWSLGVELV